MSELQQRLRSIRESLSKELPKPIVYINENALYRLLEKSFEKYLVSKPDHQEYLATIRAKEENNEFRVKDFPLAKFKSEQYALGQAVSFDVKRPISIALNSGYVPGLIHTH